MKIGLLELHDRKAPPPLNVPFDDLEHFKVPTIKESTKSLLLEQFFNILSNPVYQVHRPTLFNQFNIVVLNKLKGA